MLPLKHRLKKRNDFENLFKKGRSFFDKNFGLRFTKNGQEHTRVGISISKKCDKKAVARNRAKRITSEIFRGHISEIKQGYDILFIAKPPVIKRPYNDLEKEILSALKKAGLMA